MRTERKRDPPYVRNKRESRLLTFRRRGRRQRAGRAEMKMNAIKNRWTDLVRTDLCVRLQRAERLCRSNRCRLGKKDGMSRGLNSRRDTLTELERSRNGRLRTGPGPQPAREPASSNSGLLLRSSPSSMCQRSRPRRTGAPMHNTPPSTAPAAGAAHLSMPCQARGTLDAQNDIRTCSREQPVFVSSERTDPDLKPAAGIAAPARLIAERRAAQHSWFGQNRSVCVVADGSIICHYGLAQS